VTSSQLFRLVHYLPTAHASVGLFAALAGVWLMISAMVDFTPRGIEPLVAPAKVCHALAVLYLLVTAVLQYRLSRSGHGILAQPSGLWILLVGEQTLLLMLLAGVLVRGPTSRLYLAGMHHGVATLLTVALLSLLLAAVDRLTASRLARAIPEWAHTTSADRTMPLSIAFIVISGLLLISIGYLESQPLPNTAAWAAQNADDGDRPGGASTLKMRVDAERRRGQKSPPQTNKTSAPKTTRTLEPGNPVVTEH
jgi:hypothetical protein